MVSKYHVKVRTIRNQKYNVKVRTIRNHLIMVSSQRGRISTTLRRTEWK